MIIAQTQMTAGSWILRQKIARLSQVLQRLLMSLQTLAHDARSKLVLSPNVGLDLGSSPIGCQRLVIGLKIFVDQTLLTIDLLQAA
jgi:hypothetical protein